MQSLQKNQDFFEFFDGFSQRTYGELIEADFQCTDIEEAKKGKLREISHTMSFSMMEGKM